MQTLRFKTSLKCNGCVQAIKPGMESITEIDSWRVFLDIQDRILEVDFNESDDSDIANKVIDTVKKAGYSIEKL